MGSASWHESDVRPKVYAIEKVVDMAQVINTKVIPAIADGSIKTLVIDSLTFYADLFFAALLQMQGDKQDSRKAYGDLNNHLRDLRVKIHSLNINVLWLALAKNPDTENPIGQPMIPGQQASKFPAGCDFIFYHRSFQDGKDLKFEIRTKRYGAFLAGGRDSGVLPDPIPDPTYRKLIELLENNGEATMTPKPVIAPAKPTIAVPRPPVISRPTIVRAPPLIKR